MTRADMIHCDPFIQDHGDRLQGEQQMHDTVLCLHTLESRKKFLTVKLTPHTQKNREVHHFSPRERSLNPPSEVRSAAEALSLLWELEGQEC